MLKTKLWLNRKKTRFCEVRLYDTLHEMQVAYKKEDPHDTSHEKTLGVHLARTVLKIADKYKHRIITQKIWDTGKMQPQTGIILLSRAHCGAGVVTHEIMHAVFWGSNRVKDKPQYPIKICDMKQEEALLHNFTYAVTQFYQWYWREVDVNTKKKTSRKK